MPIAAACLVLLAIPQAAAAQRTNAPPGWSGIDQYLETVPGAGGNHPSGEVAPRRGGGGQGPPLSPSTRRGLSAQGEPGRAATRFAEQSAPRRRGTAGAAHREGDRGAGAERSTSDHESVSPLSALVRTVTGDDEQGLGIVLPILLAAVLIGAAGFRVLRRR